MAMCSLMQVPLKLKFGQTMSPAEGINVRPACMYMVQYCLRSLFVHRFSQNLQLSMIGTRSWDSNSSIAYVYIPEDVQ